MLGSDRGVHGFVGVNGAGVSEEGMMKERQVKTGRKTGRTVAARQDGDAAEAVHGKGAIGMRVKRRVVFEGVGELAEELGVSRWHLRAVLGGRRRPGAELAAKLAERGVKTRRMRPAREQWV